MYEVKLQVTGGKPRWEYARTFLECSRRVLEYIGYLPAGQDVSDFVGGAVRKAGGKRLVARVSPNGRVWKPGKYPTAEITFTHAELAWDAFEHDGEFDALAVLADRMQEDGVAEERCELLRAVARDQDPDVLFFFRHAHHDIKTAVELAEAEDWADENAEFEWVEDQDYNPEDYDSDGMPEVGWGCICRWPANVTPATEHTSLWAITFDGNGDYRVGDRGYWFETDVKPYARVVQAELAEELWGRVEAREAAEDAVSNGKQGSD